MPEKPKCPECGNHMKHFRLKTEDWVCACGNIVAVWELEEIECSKNEQEDE
jgi:ribosomal protein L37AE/L43A